MADLVVDRGLLRHVQQALTGLREELDALGAREDELSQDWGSNDLRDAMADFVGNWDDNRRRISGAMTAVADMSTTCLRRFDEVEQSLCAGLQP